MIESVTLFKRINVTNTCSKPFKAYSNSMCCNGNSILSCKKEWLGASGSICHARHITALLCVQRSLHSCLSPPRYAYQRIRLSLQVAPHWRLWCRQGRSGPIVHCFRLYTLADVLASHVCFCVSQMTPIPRVISALSVSISRFEQSN
jgi:hypothetical protein